jgi:hypothetical protein
VALPVAGAQRGRIEGKTHLSKSRWPQVVWPVAQVHLPEIISRKARQNLSYHYKLNSPLTGIFMKTRSKIVKSINPRRLKGQQGASALTKLTDQARFA